LPEATRAKKKAAKARVDRAKSVKRAAPARKPAPKRAVKATAKAAKPVRAPKAIANAAKATKVPQVAKAAKAPAANRRAPTLDRERRRATDPDLVPTPPSSLDSIARLPPRARADLAHKIHGTPQPGRLYGGDVVSD
jgi:hypothetical protein